MSYKFGETKQVLPKRLYYQVDVSSEKQSKLLECIDFVVTDGHDFVTDIIQKIPTIGFLLYCSFLFFFITKDF